MKYTILVTVTTSLLSISASAFLNSFKPRFGSTLNLERGDSQYAIKEALETSRKFGPQSKEARVAWDIVEEINASDNSIATKPILDNHEQVDQSTLLKMSLIPQIIPAKVASVKLSSPSTHKDVPHTIEDPVLKLALSNAELMTEWWGINSKQAKLAWEVVEDILSRDNSEVMKGAMDDEEQCLVDLMEACEGLYELDRVFIGAKMIEYGFK